MMLFTASSIDSTASLVIVFFLNLIFDGPELEA
jgi:hypothetical protein